ncbi:MAG: hypothetical protein EBW73_11220, partial [Betaproteobacteria bacterium]|nr:hypothetical protein [Betaproteobacteria bacterium]
MQGSVDNLLRLLDWQFVQGPGLHDQWEVPASPGLAGPGQDVPNIFRACVLLFHRTERLERSRVHVPHPCSLPQPGQPIVNLLRGSYAPGHDLQTEFMDKLWMFLPDEFAHCNSVRRNSFPQPPGDAPGDWLVVVVRVQDLRLISLQDLRL